MIATSNEELITPADRSFGYRFGCEGVLSIEKAREALGGVCRMTIYRRVNEGLLRKGQDKRRVVICRRSLREYLSGLES